MARLSRRPFRMRSKAEDDPCNCEARVHRQPVYRDGDIDKMRMRLFTTHALKQSDLNGAPCPVQNSRLAKLFLTEVLQRAACRNVESLSGCILFL